ncbi:MAG: CRP-like cAMP-binding protein [Cognaticolwellia sp.]|jgi:CRP-like cAMP-binding protein
MSSFLEHMSAERQQLFGELAEQRLLSAGETLIKRGDRGADFFRVQKGSLEVVDSSARPEVVLDVLGPGTFVGEMGFITRQPRSADVRAAEDAVVLTWKASTLAHALSTNTDLASDFYKAAALLLSQRLNNTTKAATVGALSGPALVSGRVTGARALAERLKAGLLEVERLVREDRSGAGPDKREEAQRELRAYLDDMVFSGRRLFAGLGPREAASAGELLRNELQPYLLRSRTGRLCVDQGGGRARILAHIEIGEPRGADPLGLLLDQELLRLPTSCALRDRGSMTVDAIHSVLPQRACRVLLIPAGAGTTSAKLVPIMAANGGEVTVADSDRDALGSLNSGASVGTGKVRMRLVHEELGLLSVRGSNTFFGPQDVVVLDGLVEYLPMRVLARLLPTLRKSMATGSTLVLNVLGPTPDRVLFDYLLGWRTLRRQPQEVIELIGELGFVSARVAVQSGAVSVICAENPGR